MKRSIIWAVLGSLVAVTGAWSTASAATFSSPNLSIKGSLGDSIAGAQSSSNYQLISTGGESIAGTTGSKSYKLGQGYIPSLENSMQVVVQPSGLVGYWPLDNSAPGATAFDESINSNNGTYSAGSGSAPVRVGDGWSGSGGESVTIPDSPVYPSGQKMTILAWVNPMVAAGNATVISKWNHLGASSNGSWALRLTPDGKQLRFLVSSGAGDEGANYATTAAGGVGWDLIAMFNLPIRVAVTYDGTLPNAEKIKFYYTGSGLSGVTTTGTIPSSLNDSPDDIVIGNFPGLDQYWQGNLDDIKIYNRVLTAEEIKADFDSTNSGIPAALSLANVTPGVSQSTEFNAIVQTSAPGYTLSISQNNDLKSGANTIPGISGSIGSPASWNEGATKGLGFTLFSSSATAISGAWNSGNSYAALPSTSTSFYTRTGFTSGGKDILGMRLRLDTALNQPVGSYTNQAMITGTMIP